MRQHTPETVSSHPTARIVAILAALAVVLAGLLPLAHLHADDGQSRVHRHFIDGGSHHHDDAAGDHPASLDHADHDAAKVLTLTYEHARQFALAGGPVVGSAIVTGPGSGRVTPPSRRTLLPTHDPPIRFVCSPAPPAVV